MMLSRLPAPFDDVLVEIGSLPCVHFVAYVGPDRQLIRLGVATKHMLTPKPGRGSRHRYTRDGHHFRRRRQRKGHTRLTIYIGAHEADKFPGCSAQKLEQAFAEWEARTRSWSSLIGTPTGGGEAIRERSAHTSRAAHLRLVVDNTRRPMQPPGHLRP